MHSWQLQHKFNVWLVDKCWLQLLQLTYVAATSAKCLNLHNLRRRHLRFRQFSYFSISHQYLRTFHSSLGVITWQSNLQIVYPTQASDGVFLRFLMQFSRWNLARLTPTTLSNILMNFSPASLSVIIFTTLSFHLQSLSWFMIWCWFSVA